jgi:acetyl esterase/lipase
VPSGKPGEHRTGARAYFRCVRRCARGHDRAAGRQHGLFALHARADHCLARGAPQPKTFRRLRRWPWRSPSCYPARSCPAGDYPSAHEYPEGYFVAAADIKESAQLYLGDHHDPFDPAVAPLRAASLSGLAPAVIGVAELDPLRDQGLAYADALRAAGADVFARSYPGLIHAFGAMYHIARAADAALDELARELVARVPALQADGKGR